MKNILITVPTLMAGGMERATINFAQVLSEKGFKVKIFLLASNEVFYDIPKNVDLVFGKKNRNQKWKIPFSLFRLRQLVIDFKPELVLSFSGKDSSYVAMALMGCKTHVIPFHRGNPHKIYGWFNDKLNQLIFPRCKALVVQTNIAKEVFLKKYRNQNIIVIPNPVREIMISNEIEKENIIISVSRLVKGKGVDSLIKSFKKINNADWKLYILGDGYLREYLENLIIELDLTDKVFLLGFQKDVDSYLARASVFAFTSESEGFPNALLEAMCAGLPCISYDCPTGPAEMIIDGKNGFLIPMGDALLYESKLKLLIENENLRYQFGIEAQKLYIKHNPRFLIESFIKEAYKTNLLT